MAKKQTGLENIFKKTEAEPAGGADLSDLDAGNIKPTGVGLREGEILALDAIAEAYGISRNALLRYAARHFIEDYRSGRIRLSVEEPPPPKKKLILPG